MTPLLLALALPVLGDTAKVDVAGGAETVVRGGMMAVTSGRPSQPAVDFALTLLSGVRVRDEKSTFSLSYRPRYYYQIPNIAETKLPLFLHQLRGMYNAALGQRTTFAWSGQGSVGALNYSSLLQMFPDGTAAAATSFIPLATGNTTASLNHAFSRRAVSTLGVSAAYSSLTGSARDTVAIPTTLNAGGRLGQTLQVTRRDRLGADVSASYVMRNPNLAGNTTSNLVTKNWIGSVSVNWARTLGTASSLGLLGGLGFSGFDGIVPRSIFPTFSLSITDVERALGATWNWAASAGARGYYDPLLTTFRPQGFANVTLGGQLSQYLRSELTGTFWTTLSAQPIQPDQFETNAQVRMIFRYQFTRELGAHCGGEWTLRAGHLSQFDQPLVQHQAIGFLGVRYTLSNEAAQGNWL